MKTAYQYMLALPKEEMTGNVKAMVDIILLDAERAIEEAAIEAALDDEAEE
jgi:hypothetical protein